MNMNKYSTIILAVLLLTLCAMPAQAALVVNKYTNDFTASSPYNEQLKVCSCETKVDTVIVENNGDFIADFTVQVYSSYPNRIRIAEPSFNLAPDHFKEINIYVEDSCGIVGTFPYDVKVTNSYGRVQILHRTIRVDKCQTVQFDVAPISVETGLCQPATFKVTTKNVGTFADTFSLNFGPYTDLSKFKSTELYLQPGQSYSQDVSFNFDCRVYGTKTIPFTLVTSKNAEGMTVWRDVVIRNEYNFSMDLPTSVSVCSQVKTQVQMDFANLASVPDEIAVRLNAPAFVSLSNPENVYLERAGKDDEARRLINVQPQKGNEGEYTIGVLATDIYGQKSKQRDIKLDVNNCYDPAVEMRDTNEHTVVGDTRACCGMNTYYVNVRNNGDREQLFRLQLDAPSFFKMEELTVRVAPGQNLNVPVYADLPCTDENYDAKVTVFPVAAPHVNVTTQLNVMSLTDRTCHMVQIDHDELKVRADMTVLPVIVKHTGVEGGVYSVKINSTLFTSTEKEISLEPGQEKAIHLIPKVNLSQQARGRYIVQPQLVLEEPALGIPYNEHVGISLVGKGFFERFGEWFAGLPWGKFGFCGWVITLLSILFVLVIILLLLVYSGRAEMPRMTRKSLFVLKTVLLALIIVLLLALFFLRVPGKDVMYERAANNTNVEVIEWYQNEQHVMDMSKYFEDPDKDVLRYSVTQPRDIKVNMENNLLTLTPDHNFAGENTMIITASDGKGGVADSPVFKLHIIAKKDMTFLDWMNAWCHFIVAILAILIALIVFMIVLTIKEDRQDLKRGNVIVVVPKSNKTASRKTAKTSKTTKVAKKTTAKASTKTIAKAKRSKPVTGTIVREFKAGGKTVNVSVSQPKQQAPTIITVPGAREVIYVGAKNGNTVHTPYCMNARRIPKNKRVAYSTKKDAVKAGLIPCRMCRPFEGGM